MFERGLVGFSCPCFISEEEYLGREQMLIGCIFILCGSYLEIFYKNFTLMFIAILNFKRQAMIVVKRCRFFQV